MVTFCLYLLFYMFYLAHYFLLFILSLFAPRQPHLKLVFISVQLLEVWRKKYVQI